MIKLNTKSKYFIAKQLVSRFCNINILIKSNSLISCPSFCSKLYLFLQLRPYVTFIVYIFYIILLSKLFGHSALCEDWRQMTIDEINENYSEPFIGSKTIFNKGHKKIPLSIIIPDWDSYTLVPRHIPWYSISHFPLPLNFHLRFWPFSDFAEISTNYFYSLSRLSTPQQANRIIEHLLDTVHYLIDNAGPEETALQPLIFKAVKLDLAQDYWLAKTPAQLNPQDSPLIFEILARIKRVTLDPECPVTEREVLRHLYAHLFLYSKEYAHRKDPGFFISNTTLYDEAFK